MKVKELVNEFNKLDQEAEVVVSKLILLDDNRNVYGVLNVPIVGVAVGKFHKEVRFCIQTPDNMKDLEKHFGEFTLTLGGD